MTGMWIKLTTFTLCGQLTLLSDFLLRWASRNTLQALRLRGLMTQTPMSLNMPRWNHTTTPPSPTMGASPQQYIRHIGQGGDILHAQELLWRGFRYPPKVKTELGCRKSKQGSGRSVRLWLQFFRTLQKGVFPWEKLALTDGGTGRRQAAYKGTVSFAESLFNFDGGAMEGNMVGVPTENA